MSSLPPNCVNAYFCNSWFRSRYIMIAVMIGNKCKNEKNLPTPSLWIMQAESIILIGGENQLRRECCKSMSQWTIRALRLDGRNDGLIEIITMCESV